LTPLYRNTVGEYKLKIAISPENGFANGIPPLKDRYFGGVYPIYTTELTLILKCEPSETFKELPSPGYHSPLSTTATPLQMTNLQLTSFSSYVVY
jgi:hypothetical protein